jgi:nucleoside-triphosphatase THEP1
LETAVGEVQARLGQGADVLIINKFGKHEAEGRGFRDVIAFAVEREIPVIVGANGLNKDAFLEFCGGMADEIAASGPAINDWIEATIGSTIAA